MGRLKSKEVVLRHISLRNAKRYYECFSGEGIKEFLLRFPRSVEEARKEIKNKRADFGKSKPFGECFAIVVSGKFAGYVELHHLILNGEVRTGEIGYAVHPDFRGRGIATKAVMLLTKYAFRRYKLGRITASGRVKNKASARVLEKAGYKLEKVLKMNSKLGKRYFDDFIYFKAT